MPVLQLFQLTAHCQWLIQVSIKTCIIWNSLDLNLQFNLINLTQFRNLSRRFLSNCLFNCLSNCLFSCLSNYLFNLLRLPTICIQFTLQWSRCNGSLSLNMCHAICHGINSIRVIPAKFETSNNGARLKKCKFI
jgi:hypothetical protein